MFFLGFFLKFFYYEIECRLFIYFEWVVKMIFELVVLGIRRYYFNGLSMGLFFLSGVWEWFIDVNFSLDSFKCLF